MIYLLFTSFSIPFFILFRSHDSYACDKRSSTKSSLGANPFLVSDKPIMYAIAVHNNRLGNPLTCVREKCSLEIFHEQLPLPVPCYDLAPVTEFTLGPH